MNKQHMIELLNLIENLPAESCDMNKWIHSKTKREELTIRHTCGTVGCLGGWTNILLQSKCELPISSEDFDSPILSDKIAGDWLGLAQSERYNLFYSYPTDDIPEGGWKEWMLARLRFCIEAGTVEPVPSIEDDDDDFYDADIEPISEED